MTPPANSPGRSGVAVFVITKLSNILDGKMSNENALRSDSELGRGASFNIAKLYRSFKPRITTNLLS